MFNTVAELVAELLKMPQDALPVVNMGFNELCNGQPAGHVALAYAYKSNYPQWREDYNPLDNRDGETKRLVVNITASNYENRYPLNPADLSPEVVAAIATAGKITDKFWNEHLGNVP